MLVVPFEQTTHYFELRYVFNMYELKQLNVLCVQSDTTYTVEKQLP